jgi:Zn-dependent protease with chaperone function
MSFWIRTVAGVLLLVAFPFLLFVFLVGLIVITLMLMFDMGLTWTILPLVPACTALILGLRFLTRRIDATPAGLSLVEHDHPELWALVRKLAKAVNASVPDDIRLTADANASIVEETRLLGLVSVRRRMLVGVPLMVGLDRTQLAAVLTHELAHCAKQHMWLARVAYRGRGALISTVSDLDDGVFDRLLKTLLSWWTRLYLRASSGMSRRLEWAADGAAVRAVGSTATASALRETAALEASWQIFTKNHLVMGWRAGYLPADPFGGYAELRIALHEWLNEIRATPRADISPYDSHPPLAARVAALDGMRVPPTLDGDEGQATGLLNDPATILNSALIHTLPPAAHGMRRVDWATIADIFGRLEGLTQANPLLAQAAGLTGKAPTLGTLLAVLDSGRIAGLLGEPRTYRIGPGGQREMIRPTALRDGLTAAVTTALAEVGAGRWEPNLPHRARFVPTPDLDLGALIVAALAKNPDTVPLRAALTTAGVDLNRTTTWRDDVRDQHDSESEAPTGRPRDSVAADKRA